MSLYILHQPFKNRYVTVNWDIYFILSSALSPIEILFKILHMSQKKSSWTFKILFESFSIILNMDVYYIFVLLLLLLLMLLLLCKMFFVCLVIIGHQSRDFWNSIGPDFPTFWPIKIFHWWRFWSMIWNTRDVTIFEGSTIIWAWNCRISTWYISFLCSFLRFRWISSISCLLAFNSGGTRWWTINNWFPGNHWALIFCNWGLIHSSCSSSWRLTIARS